MKNKTIKFNKEGALREILLLINMIEGAHSTLQYAQDIIAGLSHAGGEAEDITPDEFLIDNFPNFFSKVPEAKDAK